MTIRDYQEAAARFLADRKRAHVIAAAGSGKTIIAAHALSLKLKDYALPSLRIGWIANTREQCQQSRDALEAVDILNCGAHFQVSCAMADADWSTFDILICDEFHHAPAVVWRQQIERCPNIRWGLTATPGEDQQRLKVMADLFGEGHTVPRSATQANLADAQVVWLDASDADAATNINKDYARLLQWRQRFWKGPEWQLEAQCKWIAAVKHGIVNNQARTLAAVRQVTDKPTLILVNQVEHGEQIAKLINGAVCCHAGMGIKKRRESMAAFRDGSLRCMIATSLADEGLDLPMIEHLILLSGGRSDAKTEQRTGRALRTHAGKTGAVIHDFIDSFHPFMAGQSRHRRALYSKLGYRDLNRFENLLDSRS